MKRVLLDLDALEREVRARRERLTATASMPGAVNPEFTHGRASGLALALSVVRELSEPAE